MSSTRNKRKRSENDTTGAMVPSPRRRSREQRATTAPISADDNKNEAGNVALHVGADSASVAPKSSQNSMVDPTMQSEGGSTPNGQRVPPISIGVSSNSRSSEEPSSRSELKAPAAGIQNGSASAPIDDSVTKQPLGESEMQGETPENKLALALAQGNSRKSRIQGLISHRSLLLARIRLCRTAVAQRIRSDSEKNSSAATEAARKATSGEEEVAAFREMTTQATQAAKKIRSDNDVAEKRTSLSLRRGSSVGKRMNAALSSLAPGGGNSSADVASAHGTSATNPLFSKAIPKAQTGGGSSPRPISAQANLSTQSVENPQIVSSMSTKGLNKLSTQTHPSQQQMANGTEAAPKGRPLSSKTTKAYGLNNRQSSSARPDPIAMPLHMTANPTSLPPNRLSQPKVFFPEAIALRDKREYIQACLKDLLESKEQKVHNMGNRISGRDPVSLQQRRTPMLPDRRKTHWDSVLQEMSWMAADFIEERKWKLSTARTMSSQIQASGYALGSPSSHEGLSKKGDAVADMDIDARNESIGATDSAEKVTKRTSTRPKLSFVSAPIYAQPTTEELKSSRCTGKLISSMISELRIASIESGAMGKTDKYHIEALARFQKTRLKMLRSNSQPHDSPPEEQESGKNPIGGAGRVPSTLDKTAESRPSSPSVKESSYDTITTYIDDLRKSSDKSRSKASTKEFNNALKVGKVSLAAAQKEALDFAEKIWGGHTAPGRVLMGPPSCGKTFVACCMLWKRRTKGPQILICPPASTLRWQHEIGRFANLRVLTYGFSGGLTTNESTQNCSVDQLEAGDVVICEYALVDRFVDVIEGQGSLLQSAVIDCRHPTSFFASLGKQIEIDTSSESKNGAWHGPDELLSITWWNRIIKISRWTEVGAILIEFADTDVFSLSKSGLGDKQQLEIIASRAALLVGPRLFDSMKVSIQRKAISWARQKGKPQIHEKVARVRSVLESATSPLIFRVPETAELKPEPVWHVRHCSMEAEQRLKYNDCCSEVRGALSTCLAETDDRHRFQSLHAASSALLRLRGHCFHADAIEKAAMNKSRSCDSQFSDETIVGQSRHIVNPSQTDAACAEYLINGSAKLKELLSILRCECGYSLQDDVVGPLLNGDRGVSIDRSPTKIAIFASLPGVRKIVSLLLNSLGIRHELLHPLRSEMSHARTPIAPDKGGAAVSWSQYQMRLSNFNSDGLPGQGSSPRIVVASPICLAGWNQGLGIETVDTVVSLDEDWSGREQFLVSSVISRIKAHKDFTRRQYSMIRLICSDTLEANLFRSVDTEKPGMASWKWPCDTSGFLVLPEEHAEAALLYNRIVKTSHNNLDCQFPAVRLLDIRDQLLAEVLLPSVSVPPELTSGSQVRFLPFKNGSNRDKESSIELELIQSLSRCENVASFLPMALGHVGNSMQSLYGCTRFSTPSDPMDFPQYVTTRQDLKSLAALSYFEVQCKQNTGVRALRGSAVGSIAQVPLRSINVPIAGSTLSRAMISHEQTALTDTWGKSALGCTDDGTASTLLFYSERQPQISSNQIGGSEAPVVDSGNCVQGLGGHRIGDNRVAAKKSILRFNAYAKLYSRSWNGGGVQDGNQGCEPLVYFPPLFHGSLEFGSGTERNSSGLANAEMPIPSGAEHGVVPSDQEMSKRKEAPIVGQPNSKRMRFQESGSPKPISATEVVEAKPDPGELIEKGTQLMESKSSVKCSDEEQNEWQPKTESTTGVYQEQSGTSQSASEAQAPCLPSVYDDDYGLLGAGLLALPKDVARSTTGMKMSVGGCGSSNISDSMSNSLLYDFEESDDGRSKQSNSRLDSILLFVKKKSRPFAFDQVIPAYRPSHIHPVGDTPKPAPVAVQNVGHALNKKIGEDAGKKAKKKTSNQGSFPSATTPFSRHSPSGQTIQSQSVSVIQKNGHRHRLHAAFISRHFGTGLSMFESIPYQAASLHVERRVLKRMEELGWKSAKSHEFGSGLLQGRHDSKIAKQPAPIGVHRDASMGWTRVVKPLGSNASTAVAAELVSSQQRSALRLSPSRIDFAPFGGHRFGMKGISPPRSRLGVSLPMGVKVPQSVIGDDRGLWTENMDCLLKTIVLRFGMNWMLVSRAMKGGRVALQEDFQNESIQPVQSIHKTARQCRDRWQFLAQTQISVESEIRAFEHSLQERSRMRLDKRACEDIEAMRNPISTVGKIPCALLHEGALRAEMASLCDSAHSKSSPITDIPSSSECPPAASEAKSTGVADPTILKELVQQNRTEGRSFASLVASKAKRQFIPISIPGIVSGSQQNQPVPSHHSHMQSVQASVASQWSNGRTEMWPLQILDFADKQRSASRISSNVPPSSAASSARRPQKNSSHSHRPSSNGPASRDRQFAPVPPAAAIPGPHRSQVPTRPAQSPKRNVHPSAQPPKRTVPPSSTQSPKLNPLPPAAQSYVPPETAAPSKAKTQK